MTMAERLTLKKLSEELEQLRTQMQELEARLITENSDTHPTRTSVPRTGIDTEQRQRLITEEAYLIAERRGFQGGDPSQDWVEAERLVDYRLMYPTDTPKPRKKTTRAAKKPVTSKKTATKTASSAKP
jgi:hypothetical protein